MIKQIYVPDQHADNTFQLFEAESGCCGSKTSYCEYTFTFADGAVTAITVVDRDGANKVLTFAASATGPAAIKSALEAVFAIELYEDDGDQKRPGIYVEDQGANIYLRIISEIEMVSLTHAGGTGAFTELCTEYGACNFEYLDYPGGNADTLRVNGVDDTLGDLTHATATAANVKSALEGAANWPAEAVATVVKNASDFSITINTKAENSIYLGGVSTTELVRFELVSGSCAPDYE